MTFDTASSALSTNGTGTDDVEEQSAAARQLAHRLDTKEATIGVVGLGYVGLPLAVEYADRGFSTVGIDLDEERIRQLNAGDNYIEDLEGAGLRFSGRSGRRKTPAPPVEPGRDPRARMKPERTEPEKRPEQGQWA